jgi:hypothetical protein
MNLSKDNLKQTFCPSRGLEIPVAKGRYPLKMQALAIPDWFFTAQLHAARPNDVRSFSPRNWTDTNIPIVPMENKRHDIAFIEINSVQCFKKKTSLYARPFSY